MKTKGVIATKICYAAVVCLTLLTAAAAHALDLVQEFYLPMPEQQIYTALSTVQPGGTSTTQSSTYSIVVTGDGTVVAYDQWEDGYETDLRNPTQPSTQIWGDGNDANGIAPGFAHDPVGLAAGTVITLSNNVAIPRNPSVLLYDGRDRIGGSKALVVTHAGWPATQGPVFAGSVSVLSTIDYGTNYISPVGQDLTNHLFQYVGLFVMAAENGTSVTIDPDGAGATAPTTVVLNQGESYLINGGIKIGASVSASKPVQADLVIGHINASYAADWFTLTPVEQWSDSYYTPVGSSANGTQPTYVYLYNPNSTNITVSTASLNGSGTMTIPANAVGQFQMPQKSGASFVASGGAPFYALSTVAANNNNDAAYNWGFSLLPKGGLTTEADVGWAPGSSTGTVDGSPVWVTALGATRIYVDYKGDHLGSLTDPKGNKYDADFSVAALQSLKILDPSKNQTGMRVYTVDGTLITAAWGEDSDVAASGNPYIDAGTVVLPFPTPVLKKTSALIVDTGAPGISVGDTLEYTVEIDNKGLLPLGNVVVLDLPPTNLVSYVPNSTTLNGAPVPDDSTGTAYPLDTPGYTIPVILRSGTSIFKYSVNVINGGQITNVVSIAGTSIQAQNAVSTETNSSTVAFTDSASNPVSSYVVGTNVFVNLVDAGGNVTPNGTDTLSVIITNVTHGDFEVLTLTETTTNSGVFFDSTGIPTSTTAGAGTLDGILNVAPGDTLQVSFTDPIYRNTASSTAFIVTPSVDKVLYLSSTNSSQGLTRIDPVFYNHSPTQFSTDIGSGVGGGTTVPLGLDVNNVVLVTNSVTSITNSVTVSSGPSRLMLVAVSAKNGVFATGVTTTGTQSMSLTYYGGATNASGNKPYVSIWYTTNPPSGANSVVAQFSGSVSLGAALGVVCLTNVDQTTPLGAFAGTTTITGNTVTLNVPGVNANGWAFDVIDIDAQKALTPGADQTTVWNRPSTAQQYAASVNANTSHATTVIDTYVTTSNPNAAMGAVPINPSTSTGGTGPSTNATAFVQTPAFASSFTILSNQTITVSNYVTVTNGSLPGVNPAVTATLMYGTTPITTLTNATYNSGNGALVFTGTLPSNVIVPAGQAITYIISNNVANSSFHVNYDSTNAQSLISLPAGNIIHINSVGVYDAPYPNGNLIVGPTAGSTVYIRANVSDPFGNYDISKVNFTTAPPTGGAPINVDIISPVATDATSATFEFAWKTSAPLGTYGVVATANEGTEGINDVAATTITVVAQDLGTPSLSEFTSGNNGTATNNYNSGATVCLRVTDPDKNLDSTTAETILATVTSTSGDSESIPLVETTTNSGIFTACLNTSTSAGGSANDGTLLAPIGSQITLTYTDANDPTDQSSATATILPPPGTSALAVNKTLVSPASGKALVGDTLQFRLQVINTGSTTLPAVLLLDNYPSANMSFVSASPAPDVTASGSLSWTNLGTLTPGQSTNINVFFTATAAANATNTAGTSSGATTNSGFASVTITKPALTITKTLLSPTNTPVSIGSNVVFRIVAQNTGTTTIPTLPMEDNFSGAYLQFVSATIPPDGSGAGSLIWNNLASPTALAVGASITNDVTMKVVGAGNPALNTAIVDFGVDGNGKPVPPTSSTVTNLITAAAAINGHVYNDINQSGVFTLGDTGLSDVTVTLYTDPNGDGNPADGTLTQITTTDVNGFYEFLNLPLGNYVVVETDLTGYISSAPADNRRAVSVTTLTTNANNDFFDYQAGAGSLSSISGSVYYDLNGNGTNDVGETPLFNVNIDLVQDINSNGIVDIGESVVASTTTDSNGNYLFVAVAPGYYVVRQTAPFGYYSDADAVPPVDNQIPLNLTNDVVATNNNFYDRLSPTGVNDTATGSRNTGIVISPLGNDISPNGDALTICGVSTTNGTAVVNPGATDLTFTPANLGTATVIYTLCDGHGGTSSATITVTVTNSVPTANNDTFSVNQDTTLNIPAPGVLSNDTDPNTDPLTAVLVSPPTHGSLTLNPDGSFSYTPNAGYVGSDIFSYRASDGLTNSGVALVTITVNHVNHAPVANDDSYSLNEDTTFVVPAISGVLTNDTDVDGDSLSAVLVDATTNGNLVLNSDGSFTYTPNTNYNGIDTFTYKTSDSNAFSGTATVTLTINAVDDAPVGNDDSYNVDEDMPLSIAAPGVLGNDTDVETNALTAILVAGPAHGSLTLNADGSFTYTPTNNFNGADSFTYKPNDGSVDGNTATVNITVNPVNDAPVAVDDSYSTDEDTTLTVTGPGVLGNDSDVDNDPLTASVVTGPAHGSLTWNGDGSFSYTPNANYNGPDSFTYVANDGTTNSSSATVNITVVPVNDAPVAVDDTYSVNEDTTLTIALPGVLGNDTDVDNDPLTAVLVSGPAHGSLTLGTNGSFSYTPSPNYNGADSFTYKANDGTVDGNIATVNITVDPVNDAPIASDDNYSINEDTTLTVAAPGVLANDTDVDNTNLTAILIAGPTHGTLTLNTNGSFTYTPTNNYNGPDSFTYQASDSQTNSSTATVNITVIPVNDAPVANNDAYTIDEDTTLTNAAPGVLANDTDVENDTLTAILVAGPTHGTLALNADGSFSYTPATNYNGSDSFTYKANDGTADGNIATVNITVSPVNDPPVATDDSYIAVEDSALTISAPGVLANDTDVDDTNLTSVLVTGPSHGTLTLNADGSFVYTPAPLYSGPDSFVYQAVDSVTNTSTATVNITVHPINHDPVANNDSYNTDEDTTLTNAAPGVLANDTDVDGDTLTASLVTGPTNGAVTLKPDGSFTYTPATNYNGLDSFTYSATDGLATNTATVTITVNAVNDAPVAVDDSYSINEDTTLSVTVPGVLGNDSDVENDPLSATLVTGPVHGSLTWNGDGSFSYTPNANYNGPDSFTYVANDGTNDSAAATVSITVIPVNDAPVAVDDTYSVNEDTTLTIALPGVLGNDTDVDNDPLTAMLVAGPTNGTLTLSTNGSFIYTPANNYNGIDTFTYKANDGTADGNTATVTITVNAVNDAPIASDDNYSINEDTTLTVAAPGVLANDSDVDNTNLTAILIAGPTHGTLTLNTNGGFTYTPTNNYNGPDSFTYQANDSQTNSSTATVNITVVPVNDAPVAVDDSYSVNEDTTLTIALPGVLGNDTDVDNDPLTAVLVAGPTNGTLTLSTNGSFIYTPTNNYNGTDTFTYKANDGTADGNTATVTITVNAVNDAPIASDDNYSVNEDTTLTVAAPAGVLANDSDVDNTNLIATLIVGTTHGTLTLNTNGGFTYTPTNNYNGPDSFTYQASDSQTNSSTATVNITVIPVNDAPVANNDAYTIDEDTTLTNAAPGVLANDTDVENDTLTAILVAGPANGTLTLNTNGSFNYTPDANYNGADSFTYKANDGTDDGNVATVSITINPVNDAPVARDDSYSINEDTTLTVTGPGVLANDSDVDNDPLTASVVTGPAHGALTWNGDGSFSYTPSTNYHGLDSFTYQASDGTLTASATVNITVTPVNDAPVAVDDSYSVNEGTTLTVAVPGVLGNDTDVDGDTLTAGLVSGPSHGTLSLNPRGSFVYTPSPLYNGPDSFTYLDTDGSLNSSTATVNITVKAVNHTPSANDDSYSVNEDNVLTVVAAGVLTNDTDLDNDTLTASLVSGPSHGILSWNGDGGFTYTPATNYNGLDSFTYVANDGVTNSANATVTITVNPVNDAPVANADSYTINEDTTLSISAPGVLTNDTDVDSSSLTASVATGPAHGSLTLNPNGSFSYTPNANYNGPDSFTYVANDGTTNSSSATVNITVVPVNDAPVGVDDSYSVNEDTTLTIVLPGVLGNDTDVDNDPLTAMLVAGPTNGTLTLSTNGSFIYTPTNNYNGIDTFTYKANDGTADGNTATVTITVNAVNDAPVASDDNYSINEDTTLTVAAPGVLANDSDVDNTNLTAILIAGPTHGTLTLNTNGGFTYTPTNNYNGPDSFTYQANDSQTNSSTATVNITVVPVNDAPVANNDAYTLNEDTALVINGPGILANDTDVENDPLHVSTIVTYPAHGTLSANVDGSFSYTPDADYNGTDSFTYKASDGTDESAVATVSLTINPVNDAPVANDDLYSTLEDTPLTVSASGVLANDSDVDQDPITAILVSGPSHGSLAFNADGSFTYTPSANYHGPDSFQYKANDGTLDSAVATVNLSVLSVNDAPVANDDSYNATEDTVLTIPAPGVLTNDTDVDGDALHVSGVVSGPSHGTLTLNSDGSFQYTPETNYNGIDTFTYKANDGTVDSGIATVTLTIGSVDDAPVAQNDSYTIAEDTTLAVPAPGVLGNDTDVDSTNLTATLVAGPSHGSLTLNLDGSFTYTPTNNYNGSDSFTYQASDSQTNSSTATVTISVTPVNDAPVANDDSFSGNEDNTISGNVLTNDTDIDGDTLTAAVGTLPAHGTVVLNSDGTFTYTPNTNFNGTDIFTYTATDGSLTSNPATVTITVNPVNDAPVANDDSYTMFADSTLTNTAPGVLANDTDIDGNTLQVSTIGTGPAHGLLNINSDGSFGYTPVSGYVGTDTFTYKVTDGTVDSAPATVTITINPNPTPVLLTIGGSITLNAQTGMYEQHVTVTNAGTISVPAFRVDVAGLRTNITLFNATGTNAGVPYVHYNAPLDPKETVTLILKFYVPDRKSFTNSLSAEPDVLATAGTNGATGVLITRGFVDNRDPSNPRFVIEFPTIVGRTYVITYCDDLGTTWKTATPSVIAGSTKTQWYDDGAPETEGAPMSNPMRLYRATLVPANP